MAPRSVADLTMQDAVDIGKKVGVRGISGEVGDTKGTVEFLLGTTVFLGLCFYEITADFLDPFSGTLAFIGFVLTLAGMGGVDMCFVNVPAFTCIITRDFFRRGKIRVKVQGLNRKFPWELYGPDDFINMKRDVLERTSTFITKDGIKVSYRWTLQYHPLAILLGLYVSTEHEDFVTGLVDIVENKLKEIIGKKTVKEIRDHGEVSDKINAELRNKLRTDEFEAKGVTIEERFGLFIENATIGPPTFSADYQQALEAQVIRAIIQEDAKALAIALEIPTGEAMNMIAIFNKEAVKKDINEITVGDRLIEVLGSLGLVIKGLGINADKVLETLRKAQAAKTTSSSAHNDNSKGDDDNA